MKVNGIGGKRLTVQEGRKEEKRGTDGLIRDLLKEKVVMGETEKKTVVESSNFGG